MISGNPEQTLRAAQGYYELGMSEECLAELDTLPAEWCQRKEAIEIRLLVLMQAGRWEEALVNSRILCETAPDAPAGYIHAAYCLHELDRTPEAKELLIGGPASLLKDPLYYYNLACYEAQLGNHEAARAYLEQSIKLDDKYREFAKEDPDLTALRSDGGGQK